MIKSNHIIVFIGFTVAYFIGCCLAQSIFTDTPLISPCPDRGCEVTPTIAPPTPTPTQTLNLKKGKASYYSRQGCLGCSKTLTMANGEALDDTRLTVAYNHAKLNTFILVTNVKTGQTVKAKVTDRGGFERLGRIVDLSVATRDAIGCSDLCNVTIEL